MSNHSQKPKPDNRRDNLKKIQENIENTLENIQEAEHSMETASEFQEEEIRRKNARRRQSVEGMRDEVHDEHEHMKRKKKNK
ncbi:small acid-soluble spore protein (thioredoxin-like protein) [Alkalibacillus filiformis]|uniref:Small, acid-soluble spore protein Tlp n=1 Tax=Alkalibacillus filiformis TaxID=200990 RepID=A0ABU0DQK5_9BACI|nr:MULTISPECIES: small acid-soluble spore protein Tlp [Alkalibacillus]MDQ0350732.1 small acid-soluble spore protein (thioredoxin-like protein) [Alkalibacillus filiformis]